MDYSAGFNIKDSNCEGEINFAAGFGELLDGRE